MSFLPQSRSVCAFLLFAYSVLLTVTAEAAPKRLICEAETGKAAARYWSEQAARNRAYGKTKQAEQMEQTAVFCEDAAFSRQIAIHFDDTDTLLGTEQLADFEMQTLCGLERGESLPAKIKINGSGYQVSFYQVTHKVMRYFNIDRSTLHGGFVDQRDFRCKFESYAVSDGLF